MAIDIYKLEKPQHFGDLLSQIEFISKDLKKWVDKLIETNEIARQHREIISENDTVEFLKKYKRSNHGERDINY